MPSITLPPRQSRVCLPSKQSSSTFRVRSGDRRYTPESDRLLRCREMTQWAISDILHRRKAEDLFFALSRLQTHLIASSTGCVLRLTISAGQGGALWADLPGTALHPLRSAPTVVMASSIRDC
jgi:hypothetical protein